MVKRCQVLSASGRDEAAEGNKPLVGLNLRSEGSCFVSLGKTDDCSEMYGSLCENEHSNADNL